MTSCAPRSSCSELNLWRPYIQLRHKAFEISCPKRLSWLQLQTTCHTPNRAPLSCEWDVFHFARDLSHEDVTTSTGVHAECTSHKGIRQSTKKCASKEGCSCSLSLSLPPHLSPLPPPTRTPPRAEKASSSLSLPSPLHPSSQTPGRTCRPKRRVPLERVDMGKMSEERQDTPGRFCGFQVDKK